MALTKGEKIATAGVALTLGLGEVFLAWQLLRAQGQVALPNNTLPTQTAAAFTPTALPTPTPTFSPTPELLTATATPNPTETPSQEPDMFSSYSAKDRQILANIGNLDKQPKWQDVLTSVDIEYAGWTGIAQLGTDGKYHGIYADGNFHEMPAGYTPENNPITQAAWPDRVFPTGYFHGVQPLNAPDMVDGRPTVMTRIYQEDRNNIPTDVVVAKGSQILFGQGSRVELDNEKQFFDVAPAFVVSFDANLHGHLTKGEWDVLWLPKDLSPEAQRLTGLTWFGGYRASTAEWQPDVHGGDYNHANTFEISGNANTELISTPLWLNGEQSNILKEIGNQMSVSRPASLEEEKNKFTASKNLNPLDYANGNPYQDPWKAAATIVAPTAVPVFRRKRNKK